MTTNDAKYDLLKTELLLTQGQMDKYDQLSSTVKTWTMTLWAAAVGWGIQTHAPIIALLGGVSTLFFWFFDAYVMMFRLNYKDRRNGVALLLKAYAATGEFPAGTETPDLPNHDNGGIMRSFLLVHLSLPYAVLVVLTVTVFFLIAR